MKTIFIVSTVPVTFISSSLNVFKITEENVLNVVEAPEWVKDTATFKTLLKNNSIRIVQSGDANTSISDKKGDFTASAEERPNAPESAESVPEDGSGDESDASEAEPKRTSRKKKDDAE